MTAGDSGRSWLCLKDVGCLVTGGASGIGAAIVRELVACEANVIVADVDEQAAIALVEQLPQWAGRVTARPLDARDEQQAQEVVEQAARDLGSLSVLINTIGGSVSGGELPEMESLCVWKDSIDLNATTAFLCSKPAARLMAGFGGGSIVNVASIYGLVAHREALYRGIHGRREPADIGYLAGKGALIALTRGLAGYWGSRGIRVNAVAPGIIKTSATADARPDGHWERLAEQTPLQRVGTVEDVVGGVLYLASPISGYVTGQTIVIDGGWTIW